MVGAVLAGAALGAVLGALGSGIHALASYGYSAAVVAVAALALVGVAIDLRLAKLALPTTRRQVDDQWLYEYRGWFYGFGFGIQLGLGVATVVNTSSVYVTWVCALLTARPVSGAVVGSCFGLFRGLTQLASVSVRDERRLFRVNGFLERFNAAGRGAVLAGQAALAVGIVVGLS